MSDVIKEVHDRADSRSSLSNQQPSALSTLLAAEVKLSLDFEFEKSNSGLLHHEKLESQYSLLDPSFHGSYHSNAYPYSGNSFYQSYGESFNISTIQSEEDQCKPVEEHPQEIKKAWFTVKELLSLIVEDATVKKESQFSLDNHIALDGEVDLSTKVDSLKLLPAEEDGRPMEDLPDCTATTDILNMGIRDFLIVDKATKLQLVHIRIEGNITKNEPYEGIIPVDKDIEVLKEEDHPLLRREESEQTENSGEDSSSYYTLDESESLKHPDSIQFFRTDTDEIRLQEIEKAVEALEKEEKAAGRSIRSHRRRSSSGNLFISYRRPTSERWRVAKKTLTVLTGNIKEEEEEEEEEEALLASRPSSKDRKAQIAAEVRKHLQRETNSLNIPIPDPSNSLNKNRSFTLPVESDRSQTEVLERRHSERAYDEERDGDNTSRKYSNVSSRSSSCLDLNPHTSLSLSAQFSPAGSVHSREDSDDDQLGLIQIERSSNFIATSSSLYGGNSSSYLSESQKMTSLYNLSGKSFSTSEGYYSPNPNPNPNPNPKRGVFEDYDSDSAQEDDSSSDEDERLPSHLNVNTEVKLVPQVLKKHSSSSKRVNPWRATEAETETGSAHGSDKSSSRSSVTSTKSALTRFFELFGGSSSTKRTSFASESNDPSDYSLAYHPPTPTTTTLSRKRAAGIAEQGHDNAVVSKEMSIPIIQNLDTGDVFPVGALKYEAFKLLPETVSPTVLFDKSSERLRR